MSARTEVVSLLRSVLPADIDVIPYARNIDAPTKATVMVRVDKVTPSPAADGYRVYELALILIAAKTTAGPADDEVDDLLEDVLYAVTRNTIPNGVTWSEAIRATYGEPDGTNPAYEVHLAVTTTHAESAPAGLVTTTTKE